MHILQEINRIKLLMLLNEGKSINNDIPEDNIFKDFDVDSFKYQTPPEDDSKETKKEIEHLKDYIKYTL